MRGRRRLLGEWAVTPEAAAIRPGRVTFVIHNRGTMGHGVYEYRCAIHPDMEGKVKVE